MAPSYRTEDLLKVRDRMRSSDEIVRKINQSETAVQDHVLRTSSSNVSAPARSKTHSSSVETTNYEPYERIPPDDFVYHGQRLRSSLRRSKDSPSASIKRGKAEKLLKEHGSPPGVRVTAGGRIVPQGLQQLSSPQQLPSTLSQQTENLNEAQIAGAQQAHHRLVQGLGLYDQPPPWQSTHLGAAFLHQLNNRPENTLSNSNVTGYTVEAPSLVPYPFNYQQSADTWRMSDGTVRGQIDAQLSLATEEFRTVEKELKLLDRDEVINRASLTKLQEENNTRQRILLTNRLDALRKTIVEHKKTLAQMVENNQFRDTVARMDDSAQHSNMLPRQSMYPSLQPTATQHGYFMPPMVPFFQQVAPQGQLRYAQSLSPSSTELQHNMGNFALGASNPAYTEVAPISGLQVPSFRTMKAPKPGRSNTSTEPGKALQPSYLHQGQSVERLTDQSGEELEHAPRRSHALEIKKPHDATLETSSSLDPESPAYKPVILDSNELAVRANQAITNETKGDSSIMKPQQQDRDAKPKFYISQNNGTIQSDQSGSSSVSTTDFFPSDPGSYSLRKYWSNKNRTSATLPGWIPLPEDTGNKDKNFSTIIHDENSTAYKDPGIENPFASLECNIGKSIVREATDTAVEHPQASFDNTSFHTEVEQSFIDNEVAILAKEHKNPPTGPQTERNQLTVPSQPNQPRGLATKYVEGYQCGLAREVLEAEVYDPHFYKGYRDGLLASARAAAAAGNNVVNVTQNSRLDPTTVPMGEIYTSVSRASSLPSFDIPPAPFNSSSNTPVKSESFDHATVNSMDSKLEQKSSPGFVGDRRFTPKKSQPTDTIGSTGFPSPLSTRKTSYQNEGTLASPLRNRCTTKLDDQRSPSKAKASMAASFHQAQTHIQLDGDTENNEQHVLLGSAALISPTVSPAARPVKIASSPSKSFALSSFTQFAFRNKKDNKAEPYEGEPNSKVPSSPTKRRLSLGFGSPKKRKNSTN